MRPRPRLRKTAKWAGVVVCAVIIGSSLINLRWGFWAQWSWGTTRYQLTLSRASLLYTHLEAFTTSDWKLNVWPGDYWPLIWRPAWERPPYGGMLMVGLPLWMPLLVFAIPTAILWRSDRRATKLAHADRCSKCSYDRAGLAVDATCPECGTVPTK